MFTTTSKVLEAEEILELANSFLMEESWQAAYGLYQSLLSDDQEENAFLHNQIGTVAFSLGRHREALDHYNSAFEEQSDAPCFHNLSIALFETRQFKTLLALCDETLRRPETHHLVSDAHIMRGLCCAGMNMPFQALSDCTEGLNGSSHDIYPAMESHAYCCMGYILFDQNQYHQAMGYFQKIEPKSQTEYAFVQNSIGSCHEHLGDKETAQLYYESALDALPDNDNIRRNLIEVFLNQKKFRRAESHIDCLLEVTPPTADDYNELTRLKSICRRELGDTEQAKELLAEMLEIKPDDYSFNLTMAKTYLKTGNIEDALLYSHKGLPGAIDAKNWKMVKDHLSAIFDVARHHHLEDLAADCTYGIAEVEKRMDEMPSPR